MLGGLAGARASEHCRVATGRGGGHQPRGCSARLSLAQPRQPPASPRDGWWRSGSGCCGCFSGLCGRFDLEILVIGITVRK